MVDKQDKKSLLLLLLLLLLGFLGLGFIIEKKGEQAPSTDAELPRIPEGSIVIDPSADESMTCEEKFLRYVQENQGVAEQYIFEVRQQARQGGFDVYSLFKAANSLGELFVVGIMPNNRTVTIPYNYRDHFTFRRIGTGETLRID